MAPGFHVSVWHSSKRNFAWPFCLWSTQQGNANEIANQLLTKEHTFGDALKVALEGYWGRRKGCVRVFSRWCNFGQQGGFRDSGRFFAHQSDASLLAKPKASRLTLSTKTTASVQNVSAAENRVVPALSASMGIALAIPVEELFTSMTRAKANHKRFTRWKSESPWFSWSIFYFTVQFGPR